jgi:hypothetical protein
LIKLLHGLFIATLLFSTLAYSDERKIVDLVLPTKNAELDTLSQKITDNPYFIVHTYTNKLPEEQYKGNILVVVSDKLLPLLTEKEYNAKFAFYVNSNEYLKFETDETTALFSDQPLSRQLSLIKAITENKDIQVGIAYKNEKYKSEIDGIMENYPSMTITSEKIDDLNVIRSINKTIQNNDVLLSTSENDIYNSKTVRSILLSSYRHQTLVIGPTEGFVTAGALGTVFSTTDQYTQDIVSMLKNYLDTNILPKPQYPSMFNVKINYSVAESLGLIIPSEKELSSKILNEGVK